MNKRILIVITTMCVALASCHKETTLVFSTDEITVDLGATDKELLQYVKSSDGTEVTVSGVDFNKVGLHQAVFKAGAANGTLPVKVRADRLAGEYGWIVSILEKDGTVFPLGDEMWGWNFSKGENYNQIVIPDSAHSPWTNKMEHVFGNVGALTLTMEGDSLSITPWRGKFYFKMDTKPCDYSFSSIRYGRLPNGYYGVISFQMTETDGKYTNQYRFDLEKSPVAD